MAHEFFAGVETGDGSYISKLSFYALEDTGHWLTVLDDVPHFKAP